MGGNTKSFPINIADIAFLVELNGAGSKRLYTRLKTAFREFVTSGKRPLQRIKILYKDKEEEPAFDLIPKGKALEVFASRRILKDKILWCAFLDKLIKYLCDAVLSYPDTILLHSAACAKKNKGYLFLGPSNSGKTTVAELSKGFVVLSDDKILVKRKGKKYHLFQLPLLSYEFKKPLMRISPIPLDKMFFLRKSKVVRFKRISPGRAMAALLERVNDLRRLFKPDIKKTFATAYRMASSIPAFKMHFKKDNSFWRYIPLSTK